MTRRDRGSPDLAERTLRNPWFAIPWSLALFALAIRLWWIRNMALVWWVQGSEAYRRGVRVLPGKPIRFSTGELAPVFPDMVTGFVFFMAIVLGATLLLVFVLRAVDRVRRARP